MNNPDQKKILWNKAAKNGLVLGLFTAVCRILSQGISQSDASTGTVVLNATIWLVQTGGCIWIMKFLMERLVGQFDGVDNRDTARYGRLLALTSSLIFAACMLFYVVLLAPGTVSEQMDLIYKLYGQYMDENMRASLKSIENNYPQIMFFSTWLYSWLYGIVLSAILSISIPRKAPFAGFMDKKGGQD